MDQNTSSQGVKGYRRPDKHANSIVHPLFANQGTSSQPQFQSHQPTHTQTGSSSTSAPVSELKDPWLATLRNSLAAKLSSLKAWMLDDDESSVLPIHEGDGR